MPLNDSCGFTADGGAIYAGTSSTISVIDSTFLLNVATTVGATARGGAVYGDNSSNVSITGSTFDRNVATGSTGLTRSGGGLWVSGTTTNVTNSTFSGNRAETDGGSEMRLFRVTDIAEDKVVVDANHPLAGMALRFLCAVSAVRAATVEELAHGHVHGAGGHHH